MLPSSDKAVKSLLKNASYLQAIKKYAAQELRNVLVARLLWLARSGFKGILNVPVAR